MIVDNLYTGMCDYGNMDDRLARALEWLKANDLKALPYEKSIEIDGKRIIVNTQSYTTILRNTASFEAHRVYIDIQLMVEGCEVLEWTPLARVPKVKTAYDYDKDLVFFEEPSLYVPVRLEAGDFAIFFPSDVHKPRCAVADKPSPVRKIVAKVAV